VLVFRGWSNRKKERIAVLNRESDSASLRACNEIKSERFVRKRIK